MKQINTQSLGIDQGTVMLFSDFQNDGPMWAGTGPRERRQTVGFSRGFRAEPSVIVGIGLWDSDCDTNLRADVSAENITTAGFEIVFRTWGDTRIARIRVDWTAIGPLDHPDDWQV